jgi:hypothetical protein
VQFLPRGTSEILNGDFFDTLLDTVRDTVENLFDPEQWLALLEDPCSGRGVVFIVAPEPGWCQHSRSPVGSVGDIIVDTVGGEGGGVPDPVAARQEIENRAREGNGEMPGEYDAFEANATNYQVAAGNLGDRVIATEMTNQVLGRGAQEKASEERRAIADSLEEVGKQVRQAQEDIATQDVVKRQAVISGTQTVLLGKLNEQLERGNNLSAMSLLLQRNIERSTDAANKSQRADGWLSGWRSLVTGSQVGLF